MKRREFVGLVGGAVAWPLTARAQEAGKAVRIGFLRVGPPPSAWIEGLRQGLRDLGYIEGSNVTIEFGLASSPAQLSEVALELVRRKVDLIVASGTPSVVAAKHATGTIPVVFVAAVDPLATGLVQSLARPGGNVTGLTNTQADITGKQIQLLREVIAGLSGIAVIVRATSQAKARYIEEAESATRSLGVRLQIVPVGDPTDFDGTFSAARGASAIIVTDDAVFTAHRVQIAELALKNRMPCISSTSEFVRAGGLMSYGPNTTDLYRRVATYIDKILKGANPADLPVEQPTKFELAVNVVVTANVLGLTIPSSLLARADEVIE